MKSKFKLVSVMLSVMLVLAAFPTMVAGASHTYPCNRAQFIMDVTVRDGSKFAPGDTFTKTWKLRNTGTCTWEKDTYKLVLVAGSDAFGAATSYTLTEDVPPWTEVSLTITDMKAPATPGKHRSSWQLDNGAGEQFGVGWGSGVAIFAEINVVPPPSVTYDFTANAASANWTSGAGALTFPGTAGDSKGAVLSQATPKFESNVTASTPGLMVSPNNVSNGYIQGIYPAYTVNKGDRFQTTVGCEYDSTFCYVAFSLKYQIDSGPIYTFWTFRERYEGLTYSANLNLDRLAGKNVKFILYMSAYGSPTGDSAIWGNPVIVGTGSATGGTDTTGWNTYVHTSPEIFRFKFPQSAFVSSTGNIVRFPVTSGTNLLEKRLDVSVAPKPSGDCVSPLTGSSGSPSPGPTSTSGITFTKETGSFPDSVSPYINDWVAYTTEHSFSGTDTCVSISLTLLSDPTASPAYSFAGESAILDSIISTLTIP